MHHYTIKSLLVRIWKVNKCKAYFAQFCSNIRRYLLGCWVSELFPITAMSSSPRKGVTQLRCRVGFRFRIVATCTQFRKSASCRRRSIHRFIVSTEDVQSPTGLLASSGLYCQRSKWGQGESAQFRSEIQCKSPSPGTYSDTLTCPSPESKAEREATNLAGEFFARCPLFWKQTSQLPTCHCCCYGCPHIWVLV